MFVDQNFKYQRFKKAIKKLKINVTNFNYLGFIINDNVSYSKVVQSRLDIAVQRLNTIMNYVTTQANN